MENEEKGVHIFSEEAVTLLAKRVIDQVYDDLKDKVIDEIYQNLNNHLFEHYERYKEKLENEVLSDLSSQFSNDPERGKFFYLRKRMFEENKEELIKLFTEDTIKAEVKKILNDEISGSGYPYWGIREKIASFIIDNWELFEKDERIKKFVDRDVRRLKEDLQEAQDRVREFGDHLGENN